MVRRWIIRGVAVLMVVGCLGAWERSSHIFDFFEYRPVPSVDSKIKSSIRVESASGSVMILKITWPKEETKVSKFGASFSSMDAGIYSWIPGGRHWGFIFERRYFGTHVLYLATLPWWAVNVIACIIAWVAWRKTRAKLKSATAFPVEAEKIRKISK